MPTLPHDLPNQPGDDARLIARIQAGDADALLTLYRSVYFRLMRFALQLTRSRAAAEDVVQSVFMNIWVQQAEWAPNGPLQSYLYRAVRNHVLDAVRHTRVVERAETRVDPESPYGMGAAPVSAQADVEAAELVGTVAAAVRQLPERQRTAVMLRWYDDMTTAAIADIMGISRQAVERLLRAAETRLRGLLQP